MSYILDALKKANSEREDKRGGAPGLYAQPVRTQGVDTAPHKPNKTLKLLLAAGLVAAILTGLAWQQFHARMAPETQALSTLALPPFRANAPVAASITQAASPAASTELLTPKMRTAQPEQVALTATENQAIHTVTAPTTATFEAKPLAIPSVVVMPRPLPETAAITSKSEPNRPTTQQRLIVKPPAVPESTALLALSPLAKLAPGAIPKLQPLPASAPKLLVSGSTFSDNPVYRMLILNGQVFREGDSLGSELRLDQIRLKAAVVSYQGQQYSLVY